MALPEGIETCTVTSGVPVTFGGAAVKAFVSVEPSVYLVHTATGTPLVDFLEEQSVTEGVAAQFTLPVDQDGFQDENGNAYRGWFYTARITYSTTSKAKNKTPKVKVFQLVAGQTLVDLDTLPGGVAALPYTAPLPGVSSVNGQTGAVTVATELPARLEEAALNATFAPASGSANYGRSSFPSSRLVLAGDSLTDYEDAVSGSGSQWSPRGPWTWALIYLNQRLDVVKNAGIAGNTSTALLARYDADVIEANPGIVSLLIGTNDPAGAIPLATTQANITAMLDKNRAAGAVTVIRTIPPQDADDTTKRSFRIQLNNWIKTLTARKDVIVVDIMPLVTDPVTGNFATGMAYDGVHFGALGAQVVGQKLADSLAPIIPAWDRLPSSAFDPDNALTNGWMNGDGATYHQADGWTFSGTGLVLSKVNRTDGVQGQWQQITTTAAEATQKLNRTITLGTVLNVGDTVQCFTEFETDAANWGSVSQFHVVAIAKNGGTPTWYAYTMLSQGSDHWPSATFRADKGVFATPKFVIPAGSTVIEVRLVFNGIGTVRWGRTVVKKV